jgi:hypothetical protein
MFDFPGGATGDLASLTIDGFPLLTLIPTAPALDVYDFSSNNSVSVGQCAGLRECPTFQEHPVVVPQVMHFKQVPLRTMVNWPQSPHGSPS